MLGVKDDNSILLHANHSVHSQNCDKGKYLVCANALPEALCSMHSQTHQHHLEATSSHYGIDAAPTLTDKATCNGSESTAAHLCLIGSEGQTCSLRGSAQLSVEVLLVTPRASMAHNGEAA